VSRVADGQRIHAAARRHRRGDHRLEHRGGEEDIQGAFLYGLGALEAVQIGYFDKPNKSYIKKQLPGEWELLSLQGDVSMVEGELFAHLHATLSGEDFKCLGGHLFEATVAVTAEILVMVTPPMVRRPAPELGFKQLVPPGLNA